MAGGRRDIYLDGSADDRVNCDVVRYGELLFVSGCGPTDERKAVVGGDDVVMQAEQVLLNLERVLRRAGGSLADVLHVTIYLTHMDEYPLVRPVRMAAFGQ